MQIQLGGKQRGKITLTFAGYEDLERICREAEAAGVFGVPSFVLDGELFWGREHLPDIREMLTAEALPPLPSGSGDRVR